MAVAKGKKKMRSRERLVAALDRRVPDRLPVTTHHVMPYFLNTYLDGATNEQFFEHFELDPITWIITSKPNETLGEYYEPVERPIGFLDTRRVFSDSWRIESEPLGNGSSTRFRIVTPKGALTTVLSSNEHTTWVTEHLVKEKRDIDLIGEFCTKYLCDVDAVNKVDEITGSRALVRGHIPTFELFGQPGCWQDAACLVGIQQLIIETFEDPAWIHEFLAILLERKLVYVQSLKGARYDLLELGGGDGSSTVISPSIFDEFVAPYDSQIIQEAHNAGQRIVYHTCGGMMPFLERIAAMGPNAMETFTPVGMGGDTRLAEAKQRIGGKVCMIGGFNQGRFFSDSTPEETRAEVRRCFEEAGPGGGFILSPSDHFFDADLDLIAAYADEGRKCHY
jgi:uroporphyrinogen decarboxylase